jgi:hypothetical protein
MRHNEVPTIPRAIATLCVAAFLALLFACDAYASTTETIVFVRHGEKPEKGLGQLNCKGLNRALALPPVLSKMFGKPEFVFAPDPSKQKLDAGVLYDYVRPLATIEPTAIAAALPVQTAFGYQQIKSLRRELQKSKYRSSVIFVGWEHVQINLLARAMMAKNGGDPDLVPTWQEDDFDGIFVLTLTRDGKKRTATFERKTEGLNGSSDTCVHS